MTTIIRRDGGGYRVFSKGASEIVLKRLKCRWMDGWMDGWMDELTDVGDGIYG